MNPRNLVNPRRIEEGLRMGPDYKPRPVKTFFAFADKQGSFNRAVDGGDRHVGWTGGRRSRAHRLHDPDTGSASAVKRVSGIAQQRSIAKFASQPFRKRFGSRVTAREATPTRGEVLLWADTFNNFFHPETAMAAVEG